MAVVIALSDINKSAIIMRNSMRTPGSTTSSTVLPVHRYIRYRADISAQVGNLLGGASEHGGRRLPMSRFTGEPGSRCRAACERSAPRSLGEKRHLRTCNVEAWHGHAREAAARKHQLVQHLILRPGLQLLLNANGWRVGARGCAGVGLQLLLNANGWREGFAVLCRLALGTEKATFRAEVAPLGHPNDLPAGRSLALAGITPRCDPVARMAQRRLSRLGVDTWCWFRAAAGDRPPDVHALWLWPQLWWPWQLLWSRRRR